MRCLLVLILSLLIRQSASADERLRIATFNINYGNVDLPDVRRAIVEADADLICIQESTRDSERFLTEQLRGDFPHMVFKGHQGKYYAERFGFLSKTQLSHVDYTPPVDGLFGTYFASIKHNGRVVNVVNVHLSPFVVQRGSNLPQAISALTKVEAVHQKEIESIIRRIDAKNPTIVCGDFNSLSGFSAPTRLDEIGLIDSFASVTENPDSQPTWQWPLGRSKIQFRIDYVFHSDHFRTISSKIIPTTGSDHFLTVSEIELKP